MIRISSQQIFSSGISRLQDLNASLQQTSQQVSTGKRVNQPSDDPVAAARILKLDQEVARIEQFQRNAGLAENRLQQEENAISSMLDVVQRVRELTVQAGNGALTPSDRQSIASELRERLDQLATLGNARDASGEYIFSGFQGEVPAFGKNISGNWVYQGDEGQRKLELDEGVTVPISDHGKGLFVDIASADRTFFAEAGGDNVSGARISTGMVVDQDLYNQFYDNNGGVDLEVRFVANGGSPSGLDYEVVTREQPPTTVATGNFISGESIRFEGVQFEIHGTPDVNDTFDIKTSERQGMFTSIEKLIYGLENQAKGRARATVTNFAPTGGKLYINGLSVPQGGAGAVFTGTETNADLRDLINNHTELAEQGITASIENGNVVIRSGGQDLNISAQDPDPKVPPWPDYTGGLQVTGAKAEDLDLGAAPPVTSANYQGGNEAYDALVADSLVNMDNIQESLISTQTEIGGRLNSVETTSVFLEDSSVYTKDIRSQLQDVDYAEAISNLTFQSFVLQAAQQSFAQVSRLSLFDRL